MGLGGIVAEALGPRSLKDILEAKYASEREVLPLTPDGWLRVSSLADLCPRQEVLCSRHSIVRADKVSTDLQLIFDHGWGLHHVLQNRSLPEIGVLRGQWQCLGCGLLHLGSGESLSDMVIPRPESCSCSSEEFLYKEIHVRDEGFRTAGHPDGFLALPGMPGIGILEAKSISVRRAWEIRHVPDYSHAIQVQAYLWLTGLKWAKILYWDKGEHGLRALTEHTIERDQESIDKIKEMIRSIWSGLAHGGPLPERICDNASCPRASTCAAVKECFA